jgi:uncharacterized protein YxjI
MNDDDGKNLSHFFSHNDFFIDEKVAFLKFTNSYKVYNSDGSQIGSIQQTMPAFYKVLSLIINKSLLPMKLDIKDMDDNTLVSLKRGWTFFMSKMQILDSNGNLIAAIKQKFRLLKPSFTVFDSGDNQLAVISGDWKAWNFTISDANQKQIGTITKKWNGVLKEFFTTADKYIVSINPGLETADKIPILAAAITIDMVLKESA